VPDSPLRSGDFVLTLFPYEAEPDLPGPIRHAAYVIRKRAFLHFTRRFFPEIDTPGHGVIGPADKALLKEVIRQYRVINERHPEAIVNVGPLRP
jgi:hypothetical protein